MGTSAAAISRLAGWKKKQLQAVVVWRSCLGDSGRSPTDDEVFDDGELAEPVAPAPPEEEAFGPGRLGCK